jgi:hypothetical protein
MQSKSLSHIISFESLSRSHIWIASSKPRGCGVTWFASESLPHSWLERELGFLIGRRSSGLRSLSLVSILLPHFCFRFDSILFQLFRFVMAINSDLSSIDRFCFQLNCIGFWMDLVLVRVWIFDHMCLLYLNTC